jgi:hypothetical protein
MVRVDLLDANPSAFGFVRDELLELVEVPRVNARPRTVLADAFEVFHPNDGVLELFRERDEATGEFVVHVLDATLFFVTENSRRKPRPFRAGMKPTNSIQPTTTA